MKYFLILGTIRSGSSLAVTQISAHPNIAMPTGEIQLGRVLNKPINYYNFNKDYDGETELAPKKFFRLLSEFNAEKETETCGFKSAIWDLGEWEQCLKVLREQLPDVTIISTIREDMIALIGSAKRASSSGIWHSWSQPTKTVKERIYIDPLEFSEAYFHFKKIIADIRGLSATHNYCEISYEKDVLGGSDYLDRVFKKLELAPYPEARNVSRSKKVAPPPSEYIENYDELVALDAHLNKSGERLAPTFRRRINRWLFRKLSIHL
jgi:hypothetical protein